MRKQELLPINCLLVEGQMSHLEDLTEPLQVAVAVCPCAAANNGETTRQISGYPV